MLRQPTLFDTPSLTVGRAISSEHLVEEVRHFNEFNQRTREEIIEISDDASRAKVLVFVNEFWTSKQRAAHSLHEISYRACFKPQLPRFFISRLTDNNDTVYDPFMGRGTTILEAALMGRHPLGTDINPLSIALVRPRLTPPTLMQVRQRLSEIDLRDNDELPEDLLVFFHPNTLRQICSLKKYLLGREAAGTVDWVDEWIRMVAINRLTGHSKGFFSVYSLPPNQAVTTEAQRRINEKLGQVPPLRDVTEIILRKSQSLLADCDAATRKLLLTASRNVILLNRDSECTPEIPHQSVSLVVTSPPFLDVVDYATDNWLRCWFMGIDAYSTPISMLSKIEDWRAKMQAVFANLHRVVRRDGFVAFEVGEVRGGKIKLEELVIPAAMSVGFEPVLLLINNQNFTKTANTWGVSNNVKGTNSNRVVVLRRV